MRCIRPRELMRWRTLQRTDRFVAAADGRRSEEVVEQHRASREPGVAVDARDRCLRREKAAGGRVVLPRDRGDEPANACALEVARGAQREIAAGRLDDALPTVPLTLVRASSARVSAPSAASDD